VIPLAALETVIDASGIAPQVEVLLPSGVRLRQLTVRERQIFRARDFSVSGSGYLSGLPQPAI
jgi:hypothetical protein